MFISYFLCLLLIWQVSWNAIHVCYSVILCTFTLFITCCAVLAMVYVNNTSYGFMCYIYMLYTNACNLPNVKTMCQMLNTVITKARRCVMFNESRQSSVTQRPCGRTTECGLLPSEWRKHTPCTTGSYM